MDIRLKIVISFILLIALADMSAVRADVTSVGIHAVVLSDDDGQLQVNFSMANLTDWMSWANQVWGPAGFQFVFDNDLEYLNRTLLNQMDENSATKEEEREAGIAFASQYPDKLVLFFRYGPSGFPSGSGFSSWDVNFIAMPGDSQHCESFNKAVLAHEIGHYLGLDHVFPVIYPSLEDAAQAFADSGNNAVIFDGDGLGDTPPDPFITVNECQEDVAAVTLNGVVFTLPRQNLMAYYFHNAVDQLTTEQLDRADWFLKYRRTHQMKIINRNAPQVPTEAEQIAVSVINDSSIIVQDLLSPDLWSDGKQLFLGNGSGGIVELSLSVATEGFYQIDLYGSLAPDFGKFRFSLNGSLLGSAFDAYAPVVIPSGKISLGSHFLHQGENPFRIEVVGKHEDSTGYYFGVDCFQLARGTIIDDDDDTEEPGTEESGGGGSSSGCFLGVTKP